MVVYCKNYSVAIRKIGCNDGRTEECAMDLTQLRTLRSQYQFAAVNDAFEATWLDSCPASQVPLFLFEQAVALFHLGKWTPAAECFVEAYRRIDAVESDLDKCWVINGYAFHLGAIHDWRGIAILEAGLATYQPTDRVVRGYMLWNMGKQLYRSGNKPLGIERVREALDCLMEVHHGDQFCVAVDLAGYLVEDDPKEALRILSLVEYLCPVREGSEWLARFRLTQGVIFARLHEYTRSAICLAATYHISSGASKVEALLVAAHLPHGHAEVLAEHALDLAVSQVNGSLLERAVRLKRGG